MFTTFILIFIGTYRFYFSLLIYNTFECPEYVSTVAFGGGVYDDKSIKPNNGCDLNFGFADVFIVVVSRPFTAILCQSLNR